MSCLLAWRQHFSENCQKCSKLISSYRFAASAMKAAEEMSREAVLTRMGELPDGVSEVVTGYDFNKGIDYDAIFATYRTMGIQATNLSLAIDEVNKMVRVRWLPLPIFGNGSHLALFQIDKKMEGLPEDQRTIAENPVGREQSNCTIFLAFTSNMISCGTRDILRYLAEHNMVRLVYPAFYIFLLIILFLKFYSSRYFESYFWMTKFISLKLWS